MQVSGKTFQMRLDTKLRLSYDSLITGHTGHTTGEKKVRENFKQPQESDTNSDMKALNDAIAGILQDVFGNTTSNLVEPLFRRIDLNANSQESHRLKVEGNKYIFETVLPGAERKDITVELDGQFLRVAYKATVPNRFAPNFDRKWNVDSVTQEAISATLVAGVLRVEVLMSKVEDPKVVKITVF